MLDQIGLKKYMEFNFNIFEKEAYASRKIQVSLYSTHFLLIPSDNKRLNKNLIKHDKTSVI